MVIPVIIGLVVGFFFRIALEMTGDWHRYGQFVWWGILAVLAYFGGIWFAIAFFVGGAIERLFYERDIRLW